MIIVPKYRKKSIYGIKEKKYGYNFERLMIRELCWLSYLGSAQ